MRFSPWQWQAAGAAVMAILPGSSAYTTISHPQKADNDHLSVDLYVSSKSGLSAQHTPDPSLLAACGLFALVALFVALASQRERRAQHQSQSTPPTTRRWSPDAPYTSPGSARKVRWQLGNSDEGAHDDVAPLSGLYITHQGGKTGGRGHKKNAPSYDGMYWNTVDHDDDPPTPGRPW